MTDIDWPQSRLAFVAQWRRNRLAVLAWSPLGFILGLISGVALAVLAGTLTLIPMGLIVGLFGLETSSTLDSSGRHFFTFADS
ncbi:MAG: hypothetical protein WBD34_13415 [Burkholderiaceae bacterium]